MIMEEYQLIQELTELGLTERESKVYIALAQLGSGGVSDILKIASVPKSKIYEILQKLIDKGVCLESNSDYKKVYQAVNPAQALQGLLRRREDELSLLKKKTDRITEMILEFYRDPSKSMSFEFVQIIKNIDQVVNLYLTVRKKATREFLEFNKPPYISPPDVILHEPDEHASLVKKGVKIKIIHEFTVLSNQDFREVIAKEEEGGGQNRFVENLPLKMAIIDSIKVLILMMDPIRFKPLPIALLIEHPDLAATLKLIFMSMWEKATLFSDCTNE